MSLTIKHTSFLKLARLFIFVFFLIFLALSFTQKIKLITADLGRHLKNGELFFKLGGPIHTNFYSYTQPDYPVVNHHWLTGVIFFLIQKVVGFEGLSVFYTLLFLATVLLFFDIARRLSNFSWAIFISILAVPLITSRQEIRPEGFSCLFMGIFFYLLFRFRRGEINSKALWILPLLQIIWVNCHILFFLGPFLIAAFLFDEWANGNDHEKLKRYFFLGLVTGAVCLINPYGWRGALTPLTIFQDYGYRLAENQSVIFMQQRFPTEFLYAHFEGLFVLLILGFIVMALAKNFRENCLWLVLMGFFSVLAWKSIRSLAMFGFFFIPFMAQQSFTFVGKYLGAKKEATDKVILAMCSLILLHATVSKNAYYSLYQKLHVPILYPDVAQKNDWLIELLKEPQQLTGIIPGLNRSAQFFKANKLKGPIFNNYDIGGYLIYHLYPQEKVFVDNRPEAYTVAFFKDMYVPMQENSDVWDKMDDRYQFNVIYFYRHDLTPWAQNFLINRVRDPKWAPIFVDGYTIILIKRTEQNADIIQAYELPQSIFGVGH